MAPRPLLGVGRGVSPVGSGSGWGMLRRCPDTTRRDWPIHRRPGPRTRFTMRAQGSAGRPGSRRRLRVLVAIALYAVLPEPLLVGFLIPGLELALLVVLIATNPWRLTGRTAGTGSRRW
jgi:hypothetical protein